MMVAVAAVELQVSLIFRAGSFLCALRVGDVVETMRPLPCETLPGLPDFVAGLAIVRGAPVPVIVVSRLFGERDTAPGRLVITRAGARLVGLAVDEVIGFRSLSAAGFEVLPPLLGDASQTAISEIGALDGDLMMVLEGARIVSDELFASIDAAMVAP